MENQQPLLNKSSKPLGKTQKSFIKERNRWMMIFSFVAVVFIFSLPGFSQLFPNYFNKGDVVEPGTPNITVAFTISGYISKAPATGDFLPCSLSL